METMNLFADKQDGLEANSMKKLRDAFMTLKNAYNDNAPYLDSKLFEVENAINQLDYYLFS